MYWDAEKSTYLPAPSDANQTEETTDTNDTTSTVDKSKKDKDKKEKVKIAKKIAKVGSNINQAVILEGFIIFMNERYMFRNINISAFFSL